MKSPSFFQRRRFGGCPNVISAVSLVLIGGAVALAGEPEKKFNWPQWRGPDRTGVSQETALLKRWRKDGPKVLWQVNHVGVGYSSMAVVDGRIYTQGDLDGIEHILCLSAKDGSVIWAVQPEPVGKSLDEKVSQEFTRLDVNGDGTVDEAEGLDRLRWNNFNNADRHAAGERTEEETRLAAVDRAKRIVAALDNDDDGKLVADEAGSAIVDVFSNIDAPNEGADVKELAARRAKELIEEFDKDKDGKLSRNEARTSVLNRRFNQADEATEKDPNRPDRMIGDGFLRLKEIDDYLRKFEPGRDGMLSMQELATVYARDHANKDGILSKDELRGYLGGYRNSYGDGPRGTPTIENGRVYTLGGNGDLTCLEAASGKTLWHVNLQQHLGGGRPGWGYSESPLIVGEKLIVTPGGKQGTLAALNKNTGEVIWRSNNTEGAQYSSPVLATLAGVEQVVQFARNNVFGARLSDGRVLWTYSAANNGTANVCTPIAADDHVFVSSAYGTGGGLVRITAAGVDKQSADEVYFEKRMANHHGGIVKVGDLMYGFGSGGLICMDFLTGEIVSTNRCVGKGSLICAGGMLYCLGERYQMALVEANPDEYVEHGRFRIDNLGRPSWAHPVVADGVLYIRNQQRLTAYGVAEE